MCWRRGRRCVPRAVFRTAAQWPLQPRPSSVFAYKNRGAKKKKRRGWKDRKKENKKKNRRGRKEGRIGEEKKKKQREKQGKTKGKKPFTATDSSVAWNHRH
jgi:hypothetical protein